MPLLPDATINGNSEEDLKRLVAQLNEWGRLISNESRTLIIKDDTGTPRILIGYQKDGF